ELEANFEQRFDDKIENLQPEWTQFKDDTEQNFNDVSSQLADTVLGINNNTVNLIKDSDGKLTEVSEKKGDTVVRKTNLYYRDDILDSVIESIGSDRVKYILNYVEDEVESVTKEVL